MRHYSRPSRRAYGVVYSKAPDRYQYTAWTREEAEKYIQKQLKDPNIKKEELNIEAYEQEEY